MKFDETKMAQIGARLVQSKSTNSEDNSQELKEIHDGIQALFKEGLEELSKLINSA